MFIATFLIIFCCVAIITLWDWVSARASSISRQKRRKRILETLSLQEWGKAEKELQALLKKEKSSKEADLFEIKILFGKGLLLEALQKVEIKSRLYPEELHFRLEEAKILLELERPKEALAAFQICFPILRGESEIYSLALAYCQAGFPQECLDTLHPLMGRNLNGQIAALAGDAYYEMKNFKSAIKCYTHAIELGNRTYRILNQLGHAYRRQGNLSEAEKIFRDLLEKDRYDSHANLGLGACLQERGHYHKAFLIYQMAMPTQDLRILQQAAFTALKIKKYQIAETYFVQLMQQQVLNADLMACFGFALERQKKWQEAEQNYLKLIHYFPSSHQGYRALAWMFGVGLSQTIAHSQGMLFAHRALKLKNDHLSWEILSACAARTGQFDTAYQIQIALSKQDKDPKSRAHRQQTLRTLRKKMPLDDNQVIRMQVA